MESNSIIPSKLIWSLDKRKRMLGITCSLLVLVLFKKQLKSSFARFMTEHRGIFVTIFVLPVSFSFDIFWWIRGRVFRVLYSAPLRHDQRVQEIRKQISGYPTNQPMCTGRAGWLTMSPTVATYKKTMRPIRMDLYDILHLDTQRRVVRVEPLVTTGQLTAALLPQGWTLPVVPELDELTIGGLIMGFGVETSSHKHGLFQYTCVSHELILPDGRLIKASAEENSELFYSIPWSHGSIGFLVASEIRIIPAKKYVKLTYQPTFSRAELIDVFENSIRDDSFDFVEALVYSDNEAIVMTGTMTDSVEPQKLNEIGRYYKPWFYKHCQKFLADKQGAKQEYIPLRDYYHRHTKSLFWEMEDIIPFGNNVFYRHLIGWLLPPKIGLLKLTRTDALRELYEKCHVVQDMLIPLSTLSDSLDLFRQEFNIYPLWLCPMKIFETPHKGLINPLPDEDMFVDIGAYGRPRVDQFNAKESLRRVEKYVRDVHGFQALYADTYMNRKEFREMFDHTLHDELREKYNCIGKLPEIYDKVSKDARQ